MWGEGASDPGPVHLELPEDIAAEDADSETVVHEGQRGFRDDATD